MSIFGKDHYIQFCRNVSCQKNAQVSKNNTENLNNYMSCVSYVTFYNFMSLLGGKIRFFYERIIYRTYSI